MGACCSTTTTRTPKNKNVEKPPAAAAVPVEIITTQQKNDDADENNNKHLLLMTAAAAAAVSRTDSSRPRLEEFQREILEATDGRGGDLSMRVVRMHSQFGTPIEEVYDGVHDGEELGFGVSGIVRKVTHRSTGVEYAVKRLDLDRVKGQEELDALREEIIIMCQLDHPNVVRLEEAYESQSEIYLIQHLCAGGDLFDHLEKQTDDHYTEAKCANLIEQMLKALSYLHSMNIVHR